MTKTQQNDLKLNKTLNEMKNINIIIKNNN